MRIGWRVAVPAMVVWGLTAWASGQTVPALEAIKSEQELTQAVTTLDTQLFDAYNNCNLDKLGAMVADDLEFYHD